MISDAAKHAFRSIRTSYLDHWRYGWSMVQLNPGIGVSSSRGELCTGPVNVVIRT